MKLIKAIMSVALATISIILPSLTTASAASSKGEAIDASIEDVYGGANGIITPTFDDGDYPTAQKVKELCEKYDLYATLMIIPDRIPEATTSNKANVSQWREIFEDGRLEPQNHSMSHDIALGESTDKSRVDYEVLDSGDLLDSFFPTNDILCFAPRGGATDNVISQYARELAMSRYYMVRGGTVSGKTQSLSPTFTLGEPGSWSYIIAPSVDRKSVDTLKAHVDNAAKNGTWLCTLSHLVLDELPDDEKYASAYANVDAWFAYMAEVRDRGDIWVTTVSSAIKYIRERQNSTVSATYSDGQITVSIEMAEKTADNLPLTADVFNHPLTVKVAVPKGIGNVVRYNVNGECRTAEVLEEASDRYVYVDVLPNTTVTVSEADDGEPHALKSVRANAPTCLGGGTVAHLACEDCGKTFDKDGEPLESINTDAKGAHSFVDVPRVEPTESAEGNIAHRLCTVCNGKFNFNEEELSDVSIPKLEPEKPEAPIGAIIGGALGALAIAAAAIGFFFIKKKKKA